MKDRPVKFHKSLNELHTMFRHVVTSSLWLAQSVESCEKSLQKHKYVCILECSAVNNKSLKIDKNILQSIKLDRSSNGTPLFKKSLINICKIITIAAKDIIWNESDFKDVKKSSELQFLYHLRNASAHDNVFSWGHQKWQRDKTIKQFPIKWRNKIIKEEMEGDELYFNFLSSADLFLLLEDISKLVDKK